MSRDYSLAPAILALVVCAGAAEAATLEPPAQVAVSPSRFELPIGSQPTTESLTLFNYGDEAVDISVSLSHWDLDDENRVRVIEPTEQSLDQWLVVNPLQFRVEARSAQTVRFSIRPRVRPEEGEHRAMIYFDQQLPQSDAPRVRVRFRMGVAIYGHVGEPRRSGELHGVELLTGERSLGASFDISSLGSAHLRMSGQYAIWPVSSYPGAEATTTIDGLERRGAEIPHGSLVAGLLPATPVLPATRRSVILNTGADLPPGDYVLDLNGTLGDQKVDRGIPFSIRHPLQTAALPPD